MSDEVFGAQVRRHRRGLGFTQVQLAHAVGCVEDMIRKIESGRRRPSTQVAVRLAEQLAIPAHERVQFLLSARLSIAPSAPFVPGQSIPVPIDRLVGREDDLREIGSYLLRPHLRLLTLIGPGGVGKTRLALHAGAAHAHAFTGGVWFIELATLRDVALVLPTIAQVVGVHEQPTTPLATLLAQRLRGQPHLLLLDNMEHLLAAAPEVGHLLMHCPELTVLTTSRAALHIAGEHIYPVRPLALPGRRETAAAAPAVVLFSERAHAVQPQLALEQHTATVADICTRLDGLPLALELAASRLSLFSPATLLKQLDRGAAMHMLARGRQDAPARHQSLRATIAWSYTLLDEHCQRYFRQLAVFAGGATIGAMTALLYGSAAPADAEFQTVDTLAVLINNSLVQTVPSTVPRFAMLETIRQFASEQLHVHAETAEANTRHAAYFLHLAEQSEHQRFGAARQEWLRNIACDLDNMRAAIAWLLGQNDVVDALRLTVAMGHFWLARGMVREGRQWAERTLARVETTLPRSNDTGTEALRAALLHSLARLARYQNEYDAARHYAQRSLALYQQLEHMSGTARALATCGTIALDCAEYGTAQEQIEHSLRIWQELGDTWGIALALNDLGSVARCLGDCTGAESLYGQSLALHRALDDRSGSSTVLNNLGIVAGMCGDYQLAAAYLAEGLALAEALGDQRTVSIYALNLGLIAWKTGDHALARGRFQTVLQRAVEHGYLDLAATCLDSFGGLFADIYPEQAAYYWGVAEALRERIGVPLPTSQRDEHEQLVANARAKLQPHLFHAAWTAGRMVSLLHLISSMNADGHADITKNRL
ncbi:MAG: tetratricopeptide repeat protein [Roseiflexaceae bacterium]|nr:tetratricopeptide repeat protein [Roseiflexaceae bacterium]